MKTGFFDISGKLIAISEGVNMGAPEHTVYSEELVAEATANNIYYDPAADAVKFKQPFDLLNEYNKLSGIPIGTVAFTGDYVEINDGVLEFLADVEETLHISLENPRFLYEVIAVETGP